MTKLILKKALVTLLWLLACGVLLLAGAGLLWVIYLAYLAIGGTALGL